MKRFVYRHPAIGLLVALVLAACNPGHSPSPKPPLSEGEPLGLVGHYYSQPDFTGQKVTRLDRHIHFDWGQISPARQLPPGNFSAVWQAYLQVETADTYTFYLESEGQASLIINQQTVRSGESLRLEPNQRYELMLTYVKTGVAANLRLEWSSSTITRSTIPQKHLYPKDYQVSDLNTQTRTGVNLLLNGDFEGGGGGWIRYAGNSSIITPGRNAMGQALSANGWAWIQQDLPVSDIRVGETITLTGFARARNNATCTIGIAGGSVDSETFRRSLVFRESGWLGDNLSLLVPSGTVWLAIYLASNQPDCDFDDLSLVSGNAAPPPIPGNTEVLMNGGFEDGFSYWDSFGGASAIVSPGQNEIGNALAISDFAWIQQDFPGSAVIAGEPYFLSAYVKASGGTCMLGLVAASPTQVLLNRSLSYDSSDWEIKQAELIMPQGVTWLAVYLAAPEQECLFDEVSLQLDNPDAALETELNSLLLRNGVALLNPGPAPQAAKVRLGQALMHDKLLSGNKDISCATCHSAVLATGDGLSLTIGTGAQGLGPERQPRDQPFVRHSPEVFNRGLDEWRSFFWDGRLVRNPDGSFSTPGITFPEGLDNILAAQAMLPVLSALEMLGKPGDLTITGEVNELAAIPAGQPELVWQALMERLLAIEEYQTMFAAAYPNLSESQLGFQHAANAIAAFEIDAWTTLNSPFDQYLAGKNRALSSEAKRGGVLFYGRANCAVCHKGSLFTDQASHNIGVPQLGPGFPATPGLDLGAFNITGNPEDKFAFRTPALRNTAITGPWMHNGAFTTLEQVMRHYDNVPASLQNYTGAQLHPSLQGSVQTSEAVIGDILATLDGNVATPLNLSDDEVQELIAFMEALTDPRALNLEGTIPASVPSGLPIDR